MVNCPLPSKVKFDSPFNALALDAVTTRLFAPFASVGGAEVKSRPIPGTLSLVIFASPNVISLLTLVLLAAELLPMMIQLLPLSH